MDKKLTEFTKHLKLDKYKNTNKKSFYLRGKKTLIKNKSVLTYVTGWTAVAMFTTTFIRSNTSSVFTGVCTFWDATTLVIV